MFCRLPPSLNQLNRVQILFNPQMVRMQSLFLIPLWFLSLIQFLFMHGCFLLMRFR